ncbi:MAG: hypothetical protein JSR45_13035 [Proteobacteria bacterium]|nr:hypothetical protein [Pseudomonadota bacterium]
MFVGHYAAAIAAKTAAPRAPLWSYALACQALDLGWGALVPLGVEKVRIDPGLQGSTLDLYFMPFTHSLPAALIWSAAGVGLARAARLPWSASLMLGAVVFSHWGLDLLVHRPDLELGFAPGKAGLGLWNLPVVEMTLEIGLLAVTGALWAARRTRHARSAWPAAAFLAFLVALQIVVQFVGPAPSATPLEIGLPALVVYLIVGFMAWLADRGPKAVEA